MTGTDRRADLARSFGHAATIVVGVRPDQLGDPTPCPDYDVATLIDHLVGAGWRTVALGRGESPAGAEFPHIELADAPDQLRRAGQAAEAAWSDDARLAATVTMSSVLVSPPKSAHSQMTAYGWLAPPFGNES